MEFTRKLIIDLNKQVNETYNTSAYWVKVPLVDSSISSYSYYEDELDQVCSVFRGIVKNHAFSNGNKRTLTETSNEFTLSVKDGGVSHEKLESTFLFWDPNISDNYANPRSSSTITSYCNNYCNAKSATIFFLTGITSFTISNNPLNNSTEPSYKNGSMILINNNDDTNTIDVSLDSGNPGLPPYVIGSIAPKKSSLFVCLYSLHVGGYYVSLWRQISL